MSTPYYRIAHQVIPARAAKEPAALWNLLSGPEWSTWLAMVAQVLEEPVRGVGVEGVLTNDAVKTRANVEMLAVYFPAPSGPGEPYFAVLARRPGQTRVRTYVFEKGISDPGEPLRVIMAEWRVEGSSTMRIRMDTSEDPSLETCLVRTATVFNEDGGDKAPPPIANLAAHVGAGRAPASKGLRIAIGIGITLLVATVWAVCFLR